MKLQPQNSRRCWSHLEDNFIHQFGSQLRVHLRDQLWAKIDGQIWGQLRNQLWITLWWRLHNQLDAKFDRDRFEK